MALEAPPVDSLGIESTIILSFTRKCPAVAIRPEKKGSEDDSQSPIYKNLLGSGDIDQRDLD